MKGLDLMIDIEEYDILKNNMKPIKETSLDDTNDIYLTEATCPVIDFDAVKDTYKINCSLENDAPIKSVDACSIINDDIFFIEFKNGKINSKKKKEIREKIVYSSMILMDVLEVDLNYLRNHSNYIVVYNKDKNPESEEDDYGVSDRVFGLAGEVKQRFSIQRLEKFCYKNGHTYTPEQFDKFFIQEYLG